MLHTAFQMVGAKAADECVSSSALKPSLPTVACSDLDFMAVTAFGVTYVKDSL